MIDDKNTINICISHLPFPAYCNQYVDLTISPKPLAGAGRAVVVDDSYFGDQGSALSEYAQLLWLGDNIDEISSGYDYIRLFHYRRFVSHVAFGIPISRVSRWTHVKNIGKFEAEFDRHCKRELFNSPIFYFRGVRGQYASAHLIEDFENFTKYLIEHSILDRSESESFGARKRIIPACSTGIYRVETLRFVLPVLRRASDFMYSEYYVPRSGYQRRVMGFLLERLHSYLLFRRIESGASDAEFGHHVGFSDNPIWHVWRWKPKSWAASSN